MGSIWIALLDQTSSLECRESKMAAGMDITGLKQNWEQSRDGRKCMINYTKTVISRDIISHILQLYFNDRNRSNKYLDVHFCCSLACVFSWYCFPQPLVLLYISVCTYCRTPPAFPYVSNEQNRGGASLYARTVIFLCNEYYRLIELCCKFRHVQCT